MGSDRRRHAHRFSCALRVEARRDLARTRVRCCAGLSVPPARSSWICQSSSRSARNVGLVLCAQRGDVLDVDGTEIIDQPYIECREARGLLDAKGFLPQVVAEGNLIQRPALRSKAALTATQDRGPSGLVNEQQQRYTFTIRPYLQR
jgi:hypothetical protein